MQRNQIMRRHAAQRIKAACCSSLNNGGHVLLVFFLLLGMFCGQNVLAEEITVTAMTDQNTVFVGESFFLQIKVEGNDSPEEPDLSHLKDFNIQPRGGQANNRNSITIINGKVNRISEHGYVFNYQLTAQRPGRLTIPALTVKADGRTFTTDPITVVASKPEESDDFKLRIEPETTDLYVGEPVNVEITWYISQDVKGFNFNLPHMNDERFEVINLEPESGKHDPKDILRIPVGQQEISAVKGRGIYGGQDYLTVTFRQIIIPREAGNLSIPQATVSCKVMAGYRRQQRRDPFDDFFNRDLFGFGRQEILRSVVVPSNEPVLKVKPLPAEGQPADFTGLVGSYSLVVSAEPTEVRVGDPITLTLQVAGPYVNNVKLPPLAEQLDPADFKIPDEMAPGVADDVLKTFTQTIRAKHAGVKSIPSIGLPYFDTKSGRYEVARSQPIDLTVDATRVVTAQDAEGGPLVVTAEQRALTSNEQGIAHNYQDPDVLEKQQSVEGVNLTHPAILAALIVPPLGWLLLLLVRLVPKNGVQGQRDKQRRKAHEQLIATAQEGSLDLDRFEQAVRQYLSYPLSTAPGSITVEDINQKLADRLTPESISRLQQAFDFFDAQRYAGGLAAAKAFDNVKKMVLQVVEEVERQQK